MEIGMIDIGEMGSNMAPRLLDRGHILSQMTGSRNEF